MTVAGRILTAAFIIAAPMLMLHTIWRDPLSAGEDDVIYYYPLRVMAAEQINQGRWPLDNPREACGSVLMADPQSAVMHPATLLFVFLDGKLAYSLSVLAAFALAGGGTWLYLRRLGLAAAAAMFGTVAFAFCGFMVGHRVHLSIILAAGMLPWGLWCIEGLRSRALAATAWMVPVGYLAITAGHWPTLIHMVVIWTAYMFLRGRPLVRSLAAGGVALALAAGLAGPQLLATADLLAQTTRARIGYAMATENSFFPLSGILAIFPFFFGSRTPGFFPQSWWGPWHLCETLGYVGLATLVLAAGAVVRLYRKAPRAEGATAAPKAPLTAIVRTWTWLACGALLWMLGRYLPTYHLVHMLPILGVVRCPARMLLAVDMALAVLAAVAVSGLSSGRGAASERLARLGKTVARLVWPVLPAFAAATLVVVAGGAWLVRLMFPGGIWAFGVMVGGAGDALVALIPTNPAIWVPFVTAALTLIVVRFWLRSPRRRAGLLVALVLADLFVITRFVDVPPADHIGPDPDNSPAARWIKQHDPDTSAYRIWGLGDPYGHRQAELLLAKTGQIHGLRTISNYGPFQSPRHVHLLGFRIFGTNRDWARMIKQNHLLTLYNVKYVIAENGGHEWAVISSVEMPPVAPRGSAAPADGQLLRGKWQYQRAGQSDGVIRLSTPVMWRESSAWRPADVEPGTVYRISLEARCLDRGAADSLQAGLCRFGGEGSFWEDDDLTLRISAEQIGRQWRRFEWTCRTPQEVPWDLVLRLVTVGERPVEVRNVRLGRSDWPGPVPVTGRPVGPGERVYRKLVDLPALRHGEADISIFENLLYGPVAECDPEATFDDRQIDDLKWGRAEAVTRAMAQGPPSLALRPVVWPDNRLAITLAATTLPACGAYTVLLVGGLLRRRRAGKSPRTRRTEERFTS